MTSRTIWVALVALTLGGRALAVPTPAIEFDFGVIGTTSTTQTGPAHVINGGLIPNANTRWNSLGAAADSGTAVDVAAGSLLSASGATLSTVGVDFGRNLSTGSIWMPDFANQPIVRSAGGFGVYNNNVMKDMLCFNGGSYNTAFVRITGLGTGIYAVYSMHRNGFQGYPITQTACAAAGTSTTDLASVGKTALTFAADADTATWVTGKNHVLSIVEVTPSAPDILVASNSGQNNQRGCINAVQLVPLELSVGFTATDTTVYAGQQWRTPCTVRFDVTGSTGNAPTFTWNWGIDPAQRTVTNATSITYTFVDPGTNTVRLQVVDADGKAGIALQTLIFTGNAQPVARAGSAQAAYVGDTLTLSASASTDVNSGDTLSYAWTQLAGVSATLSNAASVSPTYAGTAPSTNVFQVTVTDNGDPVRSSSAVVTNYVHAKFTKAVMIDFGPQDPSTASATQKTNAPAHADGVLTAADTVWIGYSPTLADSATLPDLLNGAVDSKGSPVGLTVDLGRSNNTLVPNYGDQPFQRGGNMGGGSGYGVFNSKIMSDFLQANDQNWRSFVRLSGFAPGSYGVYVTARNTFNSSAAEYHYLRAGVGTVATQLVTSWTDDDKVGFADATERSSLAWTKQKNYRFMTVNVTAGSPDILLVSQYCSSATDLKGGVINTIQVVPILLQASFTSSADAGGRAPLTVSFDASASTGSGLSYTWTWGDGSANGVYAVPTTSHVYELPGTYNVTLQITDSNSQIGAITRAITLTGNHVPVANAGGFQAEYLASGLTMPLSATASTDADVADTLSYAWTQEAGPAVSLANAAAATASYEPTAAGTYAFRVTVTDNGDPVRSSSAVVTNLLFARFSKAVNLDFGVINPPATSSPVSTNAPAFVAGTLKPELNTWFKPSDAEDSAGFFYPVADLYTGATAADGTAVGLIIDYGCSADATWVPNWATAPAQRAGYISGDRGQSGVYDTAIGTDFVYGGSGSKLHLRIRGFQPGKYDVYVASRNIFATSLQQAVRIGVGDGSTVMVGDWQESEKLAAYSAVNVAALSATWVEGQTYLRKTVILTTATPDILVVGGFLSGADSKGGVVNLLQVVPQKEQCSVIMVR